jgi:von Willebrand factor type A C-terminal domain/von Willebrand factor type A domain
MAQFSCEVFQNEFLPDGGTDVHAVVTVTCSGAGEAGQGSGGDAAEIIIVDTSGSMQGDRIEAAKAGAAAALDQIIDGTWFAIIGGTDGASRAFPYQNAVSAMVRMDPGARSAAKQAVSRLVAGGGTAIGSWLRLATRLFESVPGVTQRHAILLTDGKNQSETPEVLRSSVREASGRFQCDCRGVGADWDVRELREVATALLGTVDIIPAPHQLAEAFAGLMRQAMGRGVAEAQLRVWTPQGARVLFVRQVSPQVEDLTGRRVDVNPLTGGYPTGAWGDESRDYHVAIQLAAKPVGAEQLAARVQLAVGGQVVTQALVKALWSDNDALTTRINPEVAHYTGQTELATAIQEGLAAKAAGNDLEATAKLGRAVQLAQETGNDEATAKLKKVVDIQDADAGTVRLKRGATKLDEMQLDTASTKTSRVRR